MAIDKKISELTAKTTNIKATDLLEVSEYNAGVYTTKKINGAQIVPYKSYITAISQSGTSAPTVTGGYSQFSGTLTFARTGVGTYTITNSVAEFTANNTFLFFQNGSGAYNKQFQYVVTNTTVINIYSWNGSTGSLNDGLLAGDSLEIKINIYSWNGNS